MLTPTAVCVELQNEDAYETGEYRIYRNDEPIGSGNKNVFSLHDLKPGTEYTLRVEYTTPRNITGTAPPSPEGESCRAEQVTFSTPQLREVIYTPAGSGEEWDDTAGLQQAIDSLREDEYLTLRGTFHVTALFLRDNLFLHIPKGSSLLGETDRTKFPILRADEEHNGIVLGTWEGRADDSFASILTGIGVRNVCIYGDGVIDCRAGQSDWWVDHRTKRIARRPKGIFLHTCQNVTLEGVTVCNTPSWNQHPFYSQNLKYLSLTLLNPPDSPTTDGLDPESCDNVLIAGCRISVGDDCIAIKSGKIEFARKYQTPSSNITIRNCLCERGHAGVTIGSENSGGVNRVCVTQCIFRGTDRGLRIKSQRGRGNLAVIDAITFRKIRMEDVKSPFVINAFYKAGNDEDDWRFERSKQPVTELTPRFLDFTFEDVVCENVSFGVGFFLGLPESVLRKVHLRNIVISYKPGAEPGQMAMTAWKETFCHEGFVCENLEELILENVIFRNPPAEKYLLRNVHKITEE